MHARDTSNKTRMRFLIPTDIKKTKHLERYIEKIRTFQNKFTTAYEIVRQHRNTFQTPYVLDNFRKITVLVSTRSGFTRIEFRNSIFTDQTRFWRVD